MSHELQIHRELYRLHESTVEIAKVGCLLMAVDAGELAKYKGKKIEDITLDPEQDESEEIGQEELSEDVDETEHALDIALTEGLQGVIADRFTRKRTASCRR